MRPLRIRRDFYESRIWKFHQIANLYERIHLQNIFEFLTPKYVDIILDARCEGGTYTKYLAEASTVIAIDISRNALENAKIVLSDFSERIDFIVCDNGHLPIRDNSVDKIASIDVIEHIVDVQISLKEMGRVSKSGGKIVIFTACGENKFTLENMLEPILSKLINLIRLKFGHIHVFSFHELCRLLEPYFAVKEIYYRHHWLGWSVKFLWDISTLKSPESHSQLPALKNPFLSALSRILWYMLKIEYKLLKRVSTRSEIIINAYSKKALHQ